MNRMGRATLMLGLAAIMTRLLWTGGFGWFVQQRMKLPLMAATAVLLAFGLYETFAGSREEGRDPDSSRRQVGPVVGWMMILPLVVLISVAPTGLGASAADRVDSFSPTETDDEFTPLDSSAGPVEMKVLDFVERALWDESRSLEDTTVRLEGLVVNDPEVPDGFKLTRFLVSCCAADGIPIQVSIRDAGPPLPDDTWVVADIVWRPLPESERETSTVVEADAIAITVVPDAPNDPYESPY